MTKSYSMDLRERVAGEAESGLSVRAIAEKYKVGKSFVARIVRARKEKQDIRPKKVGGWKRYILEPYKDIIKSKLDEAPSITLFELQRWLQEAHQIKTPISTLSRFINDYLKYRLKKNTFSFGASKRKNQSLASSMVREPDSA